MPLLEIDRLRAARLELDLARRHLPGKHNQKDHAGKKGSAAPALLDAFAGKATDDGGWAPGEWIEIDGAEFTHDLAESMARGLMTDVLHIPPEDQTDWMVEEATRNFLVDMTPPGYVLRNGNVVVAADFYRDRDLAKEAAAQVDVLWAKQPLKEGALAVRISDKGILAQAPAEALAASIRGDATISVRPGTKDKSTSEKADDNWMMPAGRGESTVAYTLTHEWGHCIDTDENSGTTWMMRKRGALDSTGSSPGSHELTRSLSQYGLTSPSEAAAEAFAEWFLSGGNPMTADGEPNRLVADIARDLGWSHR